MRENKFRAYDKLNKRFFYVTLHPTQIGWASPEYAMQKPLRDYHQDLVGISFANIEGWQQFTGLKDKNGKEIYEGDILRWHLKKGRVFSEISEQDDPLAQLLGVKSGEVSAETICTDTVEFHDGCFFLMCPDTGGGAFLNRENENVEIIGNIYENPELIERCE